jgi:hypothetical protein
MLPSQETAQRKSALGCQTVFGGRSLRKYTFELANLPSYQTRITGLKQTAFVEAERSNRNDGIRTSIHTWRPPPVDCPRHYEIGSTEATRDIFWDESCNLSLSLSA